MAQYNFSPAQKAAVFVTHGEKCYMCSAPLDLKTMEIDHVVPESLLYKPAAELVAVLENLGLPATFAINSFENGLPACRRCNNTKSNTVFKPSGLVQLFLQTAAEKADAARDWAKKTVSRKRVAWALNILDQAREEGELDEDVVETLGGYVQENRDPKDEFQLAQPVRITPLYEVVAESGGLRVIRGPYGIGAGPKGTPPSSFRCAGCGSLAFNGTRCVICGMQDDDWAEIRRHVFISECNGPSTRGCGKD